MSGFVTDFQGQLGKNLSLLAITSLSQIVGLERTQVSKSSVLRIKHQSVTATHKAVRDDGDNTKVRLVQVSTSKDRHFARSVAVVAMLGKASKVRNNLLQSGRHNQEAGRSTRSKHLLNHILEHGLGEGTGRVSVNTGRDTDGRWVFTSSRGTRTFVGVGLDVRQKRTEFTGSRGVTSRLTLVGRDDGLNVTLEFGRSLGKLISLLRLTTSLVYGLQGARNLNSLLDDLGVVTNTGRGAQGSGCRICALNGRIPRGGCGKRIRLPFMKHGSCFGLANRGHDRRILGADVIDNIREVFTGANGVKSGKCRHFSFL